MGVEVYDRAVTNKRVGQLGRMQKINHFPGMLELVRKAGTARNLNKMLLACGKPYKFFPTTYIMPADYPALKLEWRLTNNNRNHGNKTF
ncbi:tubulin polyglutamylase ttll6-like protein, partial [Chrysochromulina tobinii]